VTTSKGDDEFVASARDAAVHVDALADDTDPAPLARLLEPLLDGKRVIYLGEPDHWIDEKAPYRSLFLRYLAPRGFTCVGEEFGWFDAKLVDRYLASGDEANLERIAMFSYTGGNRDDRVDEPTGLLKGGDAAYPTGEFRANHLRVLRALRRMNEGLAPDAPRVRFFGFDIEANANSGYEHIASMLDIAPACTDLDAIRAALERVAGESMRDEVRRLDGVLATIDARLDDIAAAMGEAWAGDLLNAVQTLSDNFAVRRRSISGDRLGGRRQRNGGARGDHEAAPAARARPTGAGRGHGADVAQPASRERQLAHRGAGRRPGRRARGVGGCVAEPAAAGAGAFGMDAV
jgi:hypothetical protein